MSRTEATSIKLLAHYLYGATAPGLAVEGDIDVTPVTTLTAFPGFSFGLNDETVEPVRTPLEVDAKTDDDGKAASMRLRSACGAASLRFALRIA